MRLPLTSVVQRTVGAAVAAGSDAERRVRTAAIDTAGRATLASLDAVLASPYTEAAIDRVLESRAVEKALSRALEGPLVDALARDLTRFAVLERLVDPVLADGTAERIVLHTLDSPALDAIISRLLEREELWFLVEEIARSPAVTEAITQQSLGFADQVAADVRRTSSGADAWLERAVRRPFRRRQRGDEPLADAPV
jgi:hypothetical protein